MYFEGILSIDPNELTKIEKVKPQKAFKKIFHYLTLGNITDKQEIETFTALSMLQQLYGVFKRNNITNIIRLSHDEIDFYLDEQGKTDDLKEALDKYSIEIDYSMSTFFKKLLLILEHHDTNFKYLIEIDINRTHEVGTFPIELKITGLIQDFNTP